MDSPGWREGAHYTTVECVRNTLGVARQQVTAMIRRGFLRGVKIAQIWFVDLDSVEAFRREFPNFPKVRLHWETQVPMEQRTGILGCVCDKRIICTRPRGSCSGCYVMRLERSLEQSTVLQSSAGQTLDHPFAGV